MKSLTQNIQPSRTLRPQSSTIGAAFQYWTRVRSSISRFFLPLNTLGGGSREVLHSLPLANILENVPSLPTGKADIIGAAILPRRMRYSGTVDTSSSYF